MQGIITAGKYRFDEGQTLPSFREFLKKRANFYNLGAVQITSPFLFTLLHKLSADSFSIPVNCDLTSCEPHVADQIFLFEFSGMLFKTSFLHVFQSADFGSTGLIEFNLMKI